MPSDRDNDWRGGGGGGFYSQVVKLAVVLIKFISPGRAPLNTSTALLHAYHRLHPIPHLPCLLQLDFEFPLCVPQLCQVPVFERPLLPIKEGLDIAGDPRLVV